MSDIVEIVSGRLRDGRSIGDAYAKDMLEEITRLRAKVAKADALAEVADTPDQSDGLQGQYHYNWHRVDEALAAYREADT